MDRTVSSLKEIQKARKEKRLLEDEGTRETDKTGGRGGAGTIS